MGSSGAFTIRRATLEDAGGVLRCLRRAFAPYRHHYTEAAFEDTTLTRDSYPTRLQEMTVFVALDNSQRIVGTIACNVIREQQGHLRGMAVLPEFQAMDLANQLLACAEADLAQRKCSYVTLDTTEPLQRAMCFYERHGYRRSGKIGDFYGMALIEYVKILAAGT